MSKCGVVRMTACLGLSCMILIFGTMFQKRAYILAFELCISFRNWAMLSLCLRYRNGAMFKSHKWGYCIAGYFRGCKLL